MAEQITGTVVDWAIVEWTGDEACEVTPVGDRRDAAQELANYQRHAPDSRFSLAALVEPDEGLPGRARPSLADIQARYDRLKADGERTSMPGDHGVVRAEISLLAWVLGIQSSQARDT